MFILSQTPSIANQFMLEMRDASIQKDRLRFRKNLERLGEILAYELSKSLSFQSQVIDTPLAKTQMMVPAEHPIIISVLRAALPFYQGFLNFFDHADSGFIGAFREETNQGDPKINLGYLASPPLTGRILILTDPMLATGRSIIESINKLSNHGIPKHIHIATGFASPEGIDFIQKNLIIPHSFWIGSLDERLNEKFYIVPGLGDAGDLAFGPKI
jgi:uracil phosphoribosyltransferase